MGKWPNFIPFFVQNSPIRYLGIGTGLIFENLYYDAV